VTLRGRRHGCHHWPLVNHHRWSSVRSEEGGSVSGRGTRAGGADGVRS
jgi:hypothetical protein